MILLRCALKYLCKKAISPKAFSFKYDIMKKDALSPGGLNVILLGIVSFLNDLSSEMISPILPLLITSLGGGLIIGLIGGLRERIASIIKVVSGYL